MYSQRLKVSREIARPGIWYATSPRSLLLKGAITASKRDHPEACSRASRTTNEANWDRRLDNPRAGTLGERALQLTRSWKVQALHEIHRPKAPDREDPKKFLERKPKDNFAHYAQGTESEEESDSSSWAAERILWIEFQHRGAGRYRQSTRKKWSLVRVQNRLPAFITIPRSW